MKYLEVPFMQEVTATLHKNDIGDRIIKGRIEAYSCKMAGNDKKFYHNMHRMLEEEAKANGSESTEEDLQTRKKFISLILLLNASYPDYDFSSVRANEFERVEWKHMFAHVNEQLFRVMDQQTPRYGERFWHQLNQFMNMEECEIFTFRPADDSTDIFSGGKVWHFNYIIHSPKQKQLVYFTVSAESKLHSPMFQSQISARELQDRALRQQYGEDLEDELDEEIEDEMDEDDYMGDIMMMPDDDAGGYIDIDLVPSQPSQHAQVVGHSNVSNIDVVEGVDGSLLVMPSPQMHPNERIASGGFSPLVLGSNGGSTKAMDGFRL